MVSGDSAELKSFTDDIRISKSNTMMTRIHQLCSLGANYKSQSRPKLWGFGYPNLNFGVSGHPRRSQWLCHCGNGIPFLHPIDAFGVSVSAPWFAPNPGDAAVSK